jgi:hypothetical protein
MPGIVTHSEFETVPAQGRDIRASACPFHCCHLFVIRKTATRSKIFARAGSAK